jgi:adenine/guanine phosphoribosyltransferase-like PRPP-binding protein
MRHVLLIDDVFTTGATTRAAAKILMDAGAASVWVATLARAGGFDFKANTAFSRYSDTETIVGIPGLAPAVNLQQKFTFSSHEQSSF